MFEQQPRTGNQVQSDNNNRTGNQVQSDNNNTKPNGKIVHFNGDANNNGKHIMHGRVLGIETDNPMKPRAIGAIAMGPNKNMQGGVLFLRLTTGRMIDKNDTDFTPLLMP